ncbi:hypothetical protein GBW32_00665 [Streptomyces tsukubensis]|nr:hypothetical protein GBW32_00665 [Streptomyces tsukubensis]
MRCEGDGDTAGSSGGVVSGVRCAGAAARARGAAPGHRAPDAAGRAGGGRGRPRPPTRPLTGTTQHVSGFSPTARGPGIFLFLT